MIHKIFGYNGIYAEFIVDNLNLYEQSIYEQLYIVSLALRKYLTSLKVGHIV